MTLLQLMTMKVHVGGSMVKNQIARGDIPVDIHECHLFSFCLLERVKRWLEQGVPNEVLLELIEELTRGRKQLEKGLEFLRTLISERGNENEK